MRYNYRINFIKKITLKYKALNNVMINYNFVFINAF